MGQSGKILFEMLNLSVSLLGPFVATIDDEPLPPFRTRSVQALFIYLLSEAERPHTCEALMALLWPGMARESAQANLRQTLYRLRKEIPEVSASTGDAPVPLVLADRQQIQINPDAGYDLDVDVFTDAEPAEAITLYRGDFLADFYLPDSEPFEAWAAALARQALAIDDLREKAYRQLMEAQVRSGRRREALGRYTELRQRLQDELAADPQPETEALVAAVRAGTLDESRPAPTATTAGPAPVVPRHNLPRQLASFIGRTEEMAAVGDLLARHPLVTLAGPGGIGKTDLCLQVGRESLAHFADGVWLVELAPIRDPALVLDAVANVLGVGESEEMAYPPAQSRGRTGSGRRLVLEKVIGRLRHQNCLLILDNCEHLIDAAAHFAEAVLAQCPGVKILASSREALGVPGETPYRVPPLSLPDAGELPSASDWRQYDALGPGGERLAYLCRHRGEYSGAGADLPAPGRHSPSPGAGGGRKIGGAERGCRLS